MKTKVCIVFYFFLLALPTVLAQEKLEIKNIFDKYGKQEGVVLVQLSSDVLSERTNITFYKSLMVEQTPHREKDIIEAIKKDSKDKPILSEVNKGGKIESGVYFLGTNTDRISEYILYKKKSKKITLVYVRGNFRAERLDVELQKLKDLFIYVNNKRIKLEP